MEEKEKAFFENFIQNCENQESLNSFATAYFCNWAKYLMGKEITPLPSENNIIGIKITLKDEIVEPTSLK